ncbi:hypothetical protein KDA_17020 [Dictyobacter alpinus]|uniref:Adhesin domain-containing protein n=1 Tax=Dictyobacter alpinus TaxID=2014873 RepID=A0A402B4E5_9CHLR|nr:hypothetical protein [Dictyobacter alpinus]GCE26218.1 hypothetical protein KDA_17020 [Dictyobacter alpinus]
MGTGRNKDSHNGWHPQDEDRFVDNRYIHDEDYADYEDYDDYEEPPARASRVSRASRPPGTIPPRRRYEDVPSRPRQQPPRRAVRQIPVPQKRRTWPTLLLGCFIGMVLVIGVLALLVVLGINSIQNGGKIAGLPGLPVKKPYTQTLKQDVKLTQIASIQVCDKIGNVNLKVDPAATTTTVSALKTVQATSDAEGKTLLNQVAVEVQPPATQTKPLSCSSTQTATPTAGATPTPATGTADSANALIINVTLPKPVDNQVDLTITMPPGIIQATDHPTAPIHIEALKGNIAVDGLSGIFNLHGLDGNVTVSHAVLADGSVLETGQGNVGFSGFLLLPTDPQANGRYMLRNEKGKIDVTLPANTNVTLDANTNIGAVHSEFPITVNNNGGPVNYHGPLNPTATNTAPATLVLDVSTGDVHIQKAKEMTQ